MNDQTDSQLLGAYAGNRSEAAFAELVRRHIDFVYSAVVRMVCDRHLAEDVTQGVFVALATNASQLAERPALSGWLHRTARNIAAHTVRTIERRRAREQEASAMNELLSGGTDTAWEDISPHLDAALDDLNEADRDALLLRYFERKSASEIAQILGVSGEAAQKRVSRAVERLREFFAKRGVTVGASGLIVVISTNAVQTAPAGLAITISTAAALAGAAVSTTALTMTTLQKCFIAAALIGGGVVVPSVIQHRQTNHLRAEVAALRSQVSNATNAPAAVLQISATEEAERARRESDHRELLRLRGQLALLQSELRNYAARDANGTSAVAMKATSDLGAENPPLVSARFATRVPAGQTLISGGWINEPGKRVFMVSTPALTPNTANEGSIDIQAQVIEVSEAAWKKLGWDQLGGDPKQEMQGLVLDASQTTQLIQQLLEVGEATVRSRPRIATLNGQEAEITITGGPDDLRIGVLPTRTLDGGAFDMSLRFDMSRSSTNSPAKDN